MNELPRPEDLRPVPGRPGYHVSADGRVFSDWTPSRQTPRRSRGIDPAQRHELARPMAPVGYLIVSSRPRLPREFVHRLVLLAWIGPCPKGQQARHLDGNRLNNHLSNLAWGTPKENQADRIRHGTACFGAKNPTAKLTEEQVREILRTPNPNHCHMAVRYGVNRTAIQKVLARQTWRHIKEDSCDT